MSSLKDISDLIKEGSRLIDRNFHDRVGFSKLLKATIDAFNAKFLFSDEGIYQGPISKNHITLVFANAGLKEYPDLLTIGYEVVCPFDELFKKYSFKSIFIESEDKLTVNYVNPLYMVHTSREQVGQQVEDILFKEYGKTLQIDNPKKFLRNN
ncbi:MAG: hypothetical protein KC535_01190 [Nanoarchaeota archaeon]|nr:hypothetical protein [Nanoarchaeota archaeon]